MEAWLWDVDLHGVVWLVHGGQGAVDQRLVQVKNQGFVWKMDKNKLCLFVELCGLF